MEDFKKPAAQFRKSGENYKGIKALLCLIFVSCSLLMNNAYGQRSAKPLPRKNIDSLTALEKAAYLHAWSILKSRDTFDMGSYLWQAYVHNKPSIILRDGTKAVPGPCEHGTTLFLPWHRAELYYFEQILQQTDPEGKITDANGKTGPGTRNVTIPYWNWLRYPSGKTFPKMFEDKSSVLYRENRFALLDTPLISQKLIAYQVYFLNWLRFGGGPAESPGFGDFEAQVHNPMHNAIGEDMQEQDLAAYDPIFFSFHCFIDHLYDLWLSNHSSADVTSQDYYLRGTQPSYVPKPPGFIAPRKGGQVMGQTDNYFDTKALGYYYEIGGKDALPPKDIMLQYTKNDRQFGAEEKSLHTKLLEGGGYKPSSNPRALILVKGITIPGDSVEQAVAVFAPDAGLDTTNYQVDVYLHPKGTNLSLTNTKFKDRYLVRSIVNWGKGSQRHHHQDMNMGMDMGGHTAPKVSVAMTDELNSLVNIHKKSLWVVSVVVTELEKIPQQKVKGTLDVTFLNEKK